jgi:glutathione S-transferase
VDGDGVIYESAVINEYLEEKFPQVPLMPKDTLKRARARIWIDYCNTRLQQAAGYIAHDHEVEKSKEKLRGYLETLNQEMRDKKYLVGDYSLADITFIPFFCRLQRYQTTIGDDLPYLKAWMERLLERPIVKATP